MNRSFFEWDSYSLKLVVLQGIPCSRDYAQNDKGGLVSNPLFFVGVLRRRLAIHDG